jgi:multidrug efflux pump
MADDKSDALPGQVNLSAPFIARPVATTLLTIGLALAGAAAFRLLPVSPLPQVDFPTISVSASLPGPGPETMAAPVATPLERWLGRGADTTEMTSSSSLGSTRVTLQFDLSRDIDGAARDVQAALNAARSLLPTGLPGNPTYRKVNPADAPIMILALTSDTMTQGQMYDAGSTIIAQKLSQLSGVGDVTSAAARCRRCGSSSNPRNSTSTASASRPCARCSPPPTPTGRRGQSRTAIAIGRSRPTTRQKKLSTICR